MTDCADMLLLLVVVLNLYILGTSRLAACVHASGLQGAALAALPLALWGGSGELHLVHVVVMCVGTLVIKAGLIPFLLLSTIRKAGIRREVEPFVSLHVSELIGALLVGLAFWLSRALLLPRPPPSTLLVPAAFSCILLGFLVLVSRKKAVTQVVGYLMLENGIFIFGQSLATELPFVIEMGLLLDLLVGVFVFGITIHHISREFDDIDVGDLASLRD